MQLGVVVGQGISTIKHATLTGWKLLLVQALTLDDKPDGEPVLAIDSLGAGAGQRVIISNDGLGARNLIGHKNSPARWLIVGLCDH